MPKKSCSNSNVPNTTGSNSAKMKSSHKTSNTNNSSSSNNTTNSSGGVINSKHLHNQSHLQQKGKNNRETCEQSTGTDNLLMKKLFEAVQKQKSNESYSSERRTRKGTAPVPRAMNSSQTYAGAAFDRAPAATSFPIPSFIKTGTSENGSCGGPVTLSSSCPLPGVDRTDRNRLKSLSVSELFKTFKESESVTEIEAEISDNVEKPEERQKLQSLTNDLRKMLNLR